MNHHPDDHLNEHLSAAMDGELDQSSRRFVLKRLTEQSEAAQTWGRYHLIRTVIKGESFVSQDLSARVADQLADTDPLVVSARIPSWLKPVAGGAIAASVAALALFGMSQSMKLDPGEAGIANQPGFVSQTTPMDRVFAQPATPVGFGERSTQDVERLQRLMLQHQQAARGAGVGTYWPVVGMPPVETQGGGADGGSMRQDNDKMDQ